MLTINLLAQNNLPTQSFNSTDATKPLLIYISGDGGMNDFSKTLVQNVNAKGYPVIAFNAKTYFWTKQSPEAAAKDIAALITQNLALYKRNEVILMGYSFGADVLPFIINKMQDNVTGKIKKVVLLSPSKTTDFEVHLFYGSSGQSVPAEINKLTKSTLVFLGSAEKDTPEASITNKLATVVKLTGDHHYNNDLKTLAENICSRL